MLINFSLYGFLKNQRYFEPFLLLAFLEKGLSFGAIGWLIGLRELCVVLLEIPSGAFADLYGRRRSMIASFVAYTVSFVLFAAAEAVGLLAAGMVLFGVGEAFRTGTHKAMIFDWLRRNDRLHERTRIYGYTRSWSKIGSALSALIAAGFVFWTGRFSTVFWFSAIPCGLNIINFLTYPKYLDGTTNQRISLTAAHRLSIKALRLAISQPRLRGLFGESMALEGVFKITKDYLQPVLKSLALALPLVALFSIDERIVSPTQLSAVVIGLVFALNYLLMSVASRQAHRLAAKFGGEDRLIRRLWLSTLIIYGAMVPCFVFQLSGLTAFFLILMGVVQNLFRPAQISRFDAHSPPQMGATILSLESQAKALAAAAVAPLLGYFVDFNRAIFQDSVQAFWPIAALGVVTATVVLLTSHPRPGEGHCAE